MEIDLFTMIKKMICKNCREEINEEESFDEKNSLCSRCFDIQIANENAQEMVTFLLKYAIDFKKVNFENGDGFSFKVGGGVSINFYYAGRVDFNNEEKTKCHMN